MNRVFKKIQDVLTSNTQKFANAGVQAPETFDIYMGQPSSPGAFEFFNPAIFFDYNIDYDQGLCYIYLHCVQDFGADTENFAEHQDDGLKYIQYLKVVKRCLNKIRPGKPFGPLRLYQDVPVISEYYFYHQITLRCSVDADFDDDDIYIDVPDVTYSLESGHIRDHI